MSSSLRWKFKDIFTSKLGCACGPKSTDVTEPKPKSRPKPSTSSDDENYTSTTLSHDNLNCSKIRDSFAIVKDSKDPYQDFRNSMLQMIIEREIYSGHDLQQLLECFLELNSPRHHEVIVRAFMEIWNGTGEDGRRVVPVGSAREGGVVNACGHVSGLAM